MFDNVRQFDDAEDGASGKGAGSAPIRHRLAVNSFRGVNQERTAILGRPSAVLDIFAKLENRLRPRLADGKAFDFHTAPPSSRGSRVTLAKTRSFPGHDFPRSEQISLEAIRGICSRNPPPVAVAAALKMFIA
jgi:hypothetical protein